MYMIKKKHNHIKSYVYVILKGVGKNSNMNFKNST